METGDIYHEKIKLKNEFELFDKLAGLPENGKLISEMLIWLEGNKNTRHNLQANCGILPFRMISQLLEDNITSVSQVSKILNDYIESGSSVTMNTTYASLIAFVISYVVWYQKNKTKLADQKNSGAKQDYDDSIWFLSQQPRAYNSACMRFLDEYLPKTGAKYGQPPHARQSHILAVAANIQNTRTRKTGARSRSNPGARPRSNSVAKSGSYFDPFAK